MKKIFKIILLAFVFLFFSGILSVFLVINHYKKQLPDIETLIESYSPSLPTKVYDINGKVIDVLYKESRIPAKFDEVPQCAKDAFISIEDRRFYSHYGIDPIGILRAIVVNIKYQSRRQGPIGILRAIVVNIKYQSRRQGASTFTQQLARNAFLSHEKKISRKIKEAILTIEIEKRYTKDEIFVKYLNEIYFGDGDYGIKSAAKSLFKKDIRYINIPEAALLAGVPNRPGFYNPRKHLDNALQRMRLVLKQMYNFNMITKDQYEEALEHKFVLEEDFKEGMDLAHTTIVYPRSRVNKSMYNFNMITKDQYEEALEHKFVLEEDFKEGMDLAHTTIVYPRSRVNKSLAPSFTDLVLDYLDDNFDEEVIYNGGLEVYTTLNYDMQKVAERVFNEYPAIAKNKELQGLDDNFDEEVIYNGGLEVYTTLNYDMQKVAERVFNEYPAIAKNKELQGAMITINSSNGYITSIIGGRDYVTGNFNRAIMSQRQIGSSFKPFVYLSAIIDGYSENTIIEDSRVLYDQGWAPKNYGVTYRDNITLFDGLVRSVNSVTIKLLKSVTPKKLAENLKKLNANMETDLNLSTALGTLSVTPKDLAKGLLQKN